MTGSKRFVIVLFTINFLVAITLVEGQVKDTFDDLKERFPRVWKSWKQAIRNSDSCKSLKQIDTTFLGICPYVCPSFKKHIMSMKEHCIDGEKKIILRGKKIACNVYKKHAAERKKTLW